MSPKRAPRATPGKRVPYRPRRDRRELWIAIGAAVLIVVVTASLIWFLRPNRESTSTDTTPLTVPSTITAPTVPGDTTATTVPAAVPQDSGGTGSGG